MKRCRSKKETKLHLDDEEYIRGAEVEREVGCVAEEYDVRGSVQENQDDAVVETDSCASEEKQLP